MSTPNEIRLASLREVALRLGLSQSCVREMAERGEIPSVSLPDGSLCFDLADFFDWVAKHKRPSILDVLPNPLTPPQIF